VSVRDPSRAGAASGRDSAREPLPLGRVLRAYLTEAKFELLGALRSVGFAVPFIAIPVVIYVLFGVIIIGGGSYGEPTESNPFGPEIVNYLFAGFAVVGAIMPGIFSGCILAVERDGNLLKLKRALPAPPGATIIAKVLMSMGIAAIAVTLVAIAALVAGKLTISVSQVLTIWATLIIGVIPFCAIGPAARCSRALGRDLALVPSKSARAEPRGCREVQLHLAGARRRRAHRCDRAFRRACDSPVGTRWIVLMLVKSMRYVTCVEELVSRRL
jgi:hypothetical protein